MLQTSRSRPQAAHSDPVRTALLVAAAFATLLVAGVAAKTLLSNTPQNALSIQAPR